MSEKFHAWDRGVRLARSLQTIRTSSLPLAEVRALPPNDTRWQRENGNLPAKRGVNCDQPPTNQAKQSFLLLLSAYFRMTTPGFNKSNLARLQHVSPAQSIAKCVSCDIDIVFRIEFRMWSGRTSLNWNANFANPNFNLTEWCCLHMKTPC